MFFLSFLDTSLESVRIGCFSCRLKSEENQKQIRTKQNKINQNKTKLIQIRLTQLVQLKEMEETNQ